MVDTNTEAAAVVADLARKGTLAPQTVKIHRGTHDEAEVVLVPNGVGYALTSIRDELNKYRTMPERRAGTATLTTIAAFIAHVNRFKGPTSAVFADVGGDPSLTAVYDYHAAGEEDVASARNLKHRARYEFPMSEEWRAWCGAADKAMGQAEFAQFLEDRIMDVADPSGDVLNLPRIADFVAKTGARLATGSKLLELSTGLALRVDSKVLNAGRPQDGTSRIVFEEQHTDDKGAPLVVPSGFCISIPVFSPAEVLDAVPVRLRYRVTGPRITWSVHPYRLDLVLRAALTEAVERVRKETALPVFEGSPEA